MKALVTGSNGFIGSALVARLLRQQNQVRCLVRKTSNLQWLQGLTVEYVYGDLAQPDELQAAVEGVDVIYHLAGVTKAKTKAAYFQANTEGTRRLLDASLRFGPTGQKFVFVSSQAAGGPATAEDPMTEEKPAHPISVYGESKLKAEHIVLSAAPDKPVTVIRPPSVYGPRERDIYTFFKNAQNRFVTVLGDGTQQVSMIHVDDLITGILLAGESDNANGQLYYASGDGVYDWMTIGNILSEILDKKTILIKIPVWLLEAVSRLNVAWAGLRNKPALLNRDKVAEMKQAGWVCSNEKLKTDLGFQPHYDLETGFRQTADWYRQVGWL